MGRPTVGARASVRLRWTGVNASVTCGVDVGGAVGGLGLVVDTLGASKAAAYAVGVVVLAWSVLGRLVGWPTTGHHGKFVAFDGVPLSAEVAAPGDP